MSDFPSYSADAAYCLDEFFFHEANDINFYFEDENHESFYELLLEKLFPTINISKIFCLGGKGNVLKKHDQNKAITPVSKNIYIVDKDFDDLLGVLRLEEQIIYLPKYSIENYLFNTDAILGILIEEIKGARRNKLRADLALDAFYDDLIYKLSPLSKYFVVAQKYNSGIASSKLPHTDFLVWEEGNVCRVSDEWIEEYRQQLLAKIQWIKDCDELDIELDKALLPPKKLDGFPDTSPDMHICGKHILSIVWDYVRRKSAVNEIDPYLLTIKLLGKIDINSFAFLKNEIQSVGHRFV